MNNRLILKKGMQLFRYNLSDIALPSMWSSSLKSIEYVDEIYGPKNQAGLFFFYDNRDTAERVGQVALSNIKNKDNRDSLYITSCKLLEDIELLDLSRYDGEELSATTDKPLTLLNILKDEDLNVLKDGFHLYEHFVSLPFSSLSEDFDTIHRTSSSMSDILKSANRINSFFYDRIAYLGQSLTDFSNGHSFQSLLESKNYEGYCFMEESTPTYCLLREF